MNNVTVRFFIGNTLVRSEIFSNEMEADLYLSSEKETFSYDYYVLEVAGDRDVI